MSGLPQVSATSLLQIWLEYGQKLIEDVINSRADGAKIPNQTLLMWACATGNKQWYDNLVSAKCNSRNPIDVSQNCLELAIAFQHAGVVKRLITNQNVSPVRFQCDETPLQTAFLLAVETGNKAILEILLNDPRVDPATENSLAIALTITNRDPDTLDLLLRGDKIDISVFQYGYIDRARAQMQADQLEYEQCLEKAKKLAEKQQSYARERFDSEYDMQFDNPFDQASPDVFTSFLMQDDSKTDFCYFKRLNATKSAKVYDLLEKEFDLRGGYIINILNDDAMALAATEIFHPELNIAFANNQAFLYAVKNGRFKSVGHILAKKNFIFPQKALEIAAEAQNMAMFELLASDPRSNKTLVAKLRTELMEKINYAAGQNMAAQRQQQEILMREQMAAQAQAAALQKSLESRSQNLAATQQTQSAQFSKNVNDLLVDAIKERNADQVKQLIQNATFDNVSSAENVLQTAALQGDAAIFNAVSNNASVKSLVSAQKMQEYRMKAMFAKKNRQ